MISHQEAEVLTSARQDAPLDPVVERELQAHLATCGQCRAFAAATERLTAGLRTLPTVAANPRMKREVMTRVRAGRNPFASVLGGFGSGFQPGPALAAVALVALIGLFGWIAMDRLFLENGSDGNNQIAAVPTEVATRQVPNPTAMTPVMPTATTAPAPTATTAAETTATSAPAPTATTAPEPTVTTAPVPTATTAPQPTATTAPVPTATTALAPTETTAPAPTATTPPEPTATTAPQPTETEAGSSARTSGEGPVDLTTSTEITIEPTETAVPPTETAVPTATEVPPTETPVPTATSAPTETPMPTATDVPPTETPVPTETPEPVPSPTPGIEPMEGSTSVPVEQGSNAAESGVGSADTEAIVPTSGVETGQNGEAASSVTPPATESVGDGTGGTEEPVGIELIGTDGETTTVETATVETTAEDGTEATTPGATEAVESGPATETLAGVSEPYQGIVGDPSEQLGLTRDGRLEFVTVPDGASMTTSDGYRLQSSEVQPGVVNLCTDGVCEPGMSAPENAEGWQGDVPMGTVDGTVYILRLYADRSEVYAASAEGTQLVDASVAGQIGPTSPPAAVYESGGTLYAWLPSGQWLEMSGGSAQALSGSYANPSNVRFAPSANGGPLIGYFSGGTLVVAPVGAPDSAILTLPVDGADFDISPPGDRVAVIQGNSIVIYDMQGNQLAMYDGEGMQPGSLIWLRGGIVWVDRNDGTLYQIPETAP